MSPDIEEDYRTIINRDVNQLSFNNIYPYYKSIKFQLQRGIVEVFYCTMRGHEDYFKVLYDKIWTLTAAAITIKRARKAQCSATTIAQYRRVSQTIVTDTILTLKGIALWTKKLEIYGPSLG